MSKRDLLTISDVPVVIFGHICVYSSVEFIVKLDLEDLDPSMPNINYLVKSTASKNLNIIICLSVQTKVLTGSQRLQKLIS